jgi:hypothetical protein
LPVAFKVYREIACCDARTISSNTNAIVVLGALFRCMMHESM